MPSLGIRFNIEELEKHDSSIYARPAWEVVLRTFGIKNFSGETDLFEGDTADTVSGREYVYCLAIKNSDSALLNSIRDSLQKSEAFNAIANATPFVEGSILSIEPLVPAAHIDKKGDFEIKPGSCLRLVLTQLRAEGRTASKGGSVPVAERPSPASKRSAHLPDIKSLGDLEAFLSKTFSHGDAHPDIYFFLTPEELCDLAAKYEGIFCFYWEEDRDRDEITITITQPFKYDEYVETEVDTLTFEGLRAFASNADAIGYCRKEEFNPARWGIKGAVAVYFQGASHTIPSYWEKEELEEFQKLQVSPDELWEKICERRQQLDIAAPTPFVKKWWHFWK